MRLFIQIILQILFTSYLYSATGVSIDTFFTGNEKNVLLNNKIITRVFLEGNSTGDKNRIIIPKTRYTNEDFSKYEMVVTEKAFIPYNLKNRGKIRLYNNLHAYSKLKGVSYYSITDKEIKPFILDSYRLDSIEGSNRRTKRRDIIYNSIQKKRIHYFQIKDNRFGELVFQSTIYNRGDNFILKNGCIHPMKKFTFSINREGEYHYILFLLYDKNARGYFCYSVQAMRIRSWYFKNIGLLSPKSFVNRIRAMTVHLATILGHDWKSRIKAKD